MAVAVNRTELQQVMTHARKEVSTASHYISIAVFATAVTLFTYNTLQAKTTYTVSVAGRRMDASSGASHAVGPLLWTADSPKYFMILWVMNSRSLSQLFST